MTVMMTTTTMTGSMTMTDDFAQMLADIDAILETDFDTQLAVERDPYGATRAIEAALYMLRDQAARVEDLTGQNLRLSGMFYDLKKEVAISDALLISEAEVSLERLARIEQLTAERDRLREALQLYAEPCDATETSPCGYKGNMCCRTAREALKGESHE